MEPVTVSPLPAPPNAPPDDLDMGLVRLYKDASYVSATLNLRMSDYRADTIHSIGGTQMQDKATWLGYRLNPGQVVTLFDNNETTTPPDLSKLGKTIDLVGDGQTHFVNLTAMGLNDRITAFFWRNVDLEDGVIELYEDADFKGFRTCIFLSEWEPETTHDISDWKIGGSLSSVKWNLPDGFFFDLFAHSDGGGQAFKNIQGPEPGAIPRLSQYSFNDKASSFQWTRAVPVREYVKEIVFGTVTPVRQVEQVVSLRSGENRSSAEQEQSLSFTNQVTEATSVTVTDTHSFGAAMSYTYTNKPPEGTGGSESSVSLQLSYNYEHGTVTSSSKEESRTVEFTDTIRIPAQSAWEDKLIATMDVVNIDFTTTATRWYKQQLEGTEPDDGLYRRDETVTGTFKGTLFVKVHTTFQATPIDQGS